MHNRARSSTPCCFPPPPHPPPFQELVRSIHAPQRFWAAPRERGMWEKEVCFLWRTMGRMCPDLEDAQYLQHFRMSEDTFWFLSQTYGKYLERQDTRLRCAIPAAKRLAIVLHWLARAPSFSQLAAMYALGKSTVISVVHQGIDILHERLTPNAILFPWHLSFSK